MGLLSFLFGKKEDQGFQKTKINSIPTVKLSQERKNFFHDSFYSYMESLEYFSHEEIESMLKIIESTEGGFVNRVWQPRIYHDFFKNRNWTWPLLEKWREILIDNGAEWLSKNYQEENDTDIFFDAVNVLKIKEIQNILNDVGVNFKKSMSKDGLVNLLISSLSEEWLTQNIEKFNDAMHIAINKKIDFKYKEYRVLMRDIEMRAENLHSMSISAKGGITVSYYSFFSAGIVSPEFSKKIAQKNIGEIPPLYPGDVTRLRPDLSSFKASAKEIMPKLKMPKSG